MVFAATGTAVGVGVVIGVIIVVVVVGGGGAGGGTGGTTAAGRPHHDAGQAGIAERVDFRLKDRRTLHIWIVRRCRLRIHRSRTGHFWGGRTL